jgi:hypothetical protein
LDPKVIELGADIRKVLRSDGLDPVAILVRSRREIEQGLNLFERKAQLACAPHESEALDVLRPVVAVGTLACRRADNANAFVKTGLSRCCIRCVSLPRQFSHPASSVCSCYRLKIGARIEVCKRTSDAQLRHMVERFGDRRRHCCRIRGRRAAVEEGILPGGGIALLRALKSLEGLKAANDDQQSSIDIVRRALRAPARQIADNAGEDGAYIVGKLLEGDDYNHGFNAATGEYEDLVKSGVIDPAKVVRTALQIAASVAWLLITTETLVPELPIEDTPAPMPAMDS